MKTRKIFTMNTLRNCAAITAVKLTLGTATQAANIVEFASDNDRFKTQVAAVSAAGLVETLQGPGPLTVCTPLNDAFAALPAGTLSGAPKIRAMEIINELEPSSRGIYGGAIGYIGWNGNMDTAIAIRTAVIKDQTIHVGAGAGIVADSVPENEWLECRQKSKVFMDAMEMIS